MLIVTELGIEPGLRICTRILTTSIFSIRQERTPRTPQESSRIYLSAKYQRPPRTKASPVKRENASGACGRLESTRHESG